MAKTDKEIDVSELTTDIYALNVEHSIRNTTPFKPLQHTNLGPALNT